MITIVYVDFYGKKHTIKAYRIRVLKRTVWCEGSSEEQDRWVPIKEIVSVTEPLEGLA